MANRTARGRRCVPCRSLSADFARHGDRETEARIAQYELGYRIARDPVRVKDFQATVLHLLGLDHLRLGHMHAGLNHRLTGVQGYARVIPGLLA